MGFLLAVVVGLLGSVLLLASGTMVSTIALPPDRTDDRVHRPVAAALLAVGWAFGVVPSFAFFVYLLTGLHVSLLSLAGVTALHVGAAWWVDRRAARAGRPSGRSLWLDPWRASLPALGRPLAGAGAVAHVFFVLWDPSPPPPQASCIHQVALMATGADDQEANPLTENIEDARLGNGAVLAGFFALYREVGTRATYAACGLLLALGGFLLGWLVGGRERWGWVALAVLPLNPYVLGLPQADQNLITLAFSMSALPLLLLRRVPWASVGVLFGLVVTTRHVMVLALPAILVLTRLDWRALARFGGAFFAQTALENLHHHLALGSVLRFESNEQFPVLQYSFAGLEFSWEGMLNWPLHEEIVRTVYNPLPTFALWPLALADHFGALLYAVLLTGMVAIWWRSRREAAFWMLFVGPAAIALALQEAWDTPNKMGVLVILFPAVTAWLVDGGRWATARWKVALPLVALLAVGVQQGSGALERWSVPVDERYLQTFSETPVENIAFARNEARFATDVGFLPDYARIQRAGSRLQPRRLTAIVGEDGALDLERGSRPWGWAWSELPDPGEPVTVELDLTDLPCDTGQFLRRTDEPAHVALQPGQIVRLGGIPVHWDRRPLGVYAMAGPEITTIAIVFTRPGELDELHRCRFAHNEFQAPTDGRCSLLYDLAGVRATPATTAVAWPEQIDLDTARVRLQLPTGGVSAALMLVPMADRFVLWRAEVEVDGIAVDQPRQPWHN